jgi:hypothetical protein
MRNGLYRIGDHVQVTMVDDMKYDGILTDYDDIAIYLNGLGFPRDDIKTDGLELYDGA